MVNRGTLHTAAAPPECGEHFDELLRLRNLRIERIVSSDTPAPTLYDQPQDEWVLLLTGSAILDVEDTRIELSAGDYLFLPAHTPHRVIKTSASPLCTWLAVHLDPQAPEQGSSGR